MDLFPKRMFIALPVSVPGVEPVRRELEKSANCLKVVHDNNYHITLKFLGDTDRARCSELVSAMDVVQRPKMVECLVKGLGCFPGLSNPSVLWAGMEYNSSLMDELFFFAEKPAVAAGFTPERRKFVPHLTLARVRREVTFPASLRDYIRSNRDTVYEQCVIDRVVLFESVLKKGGPEYTVYREWELI